MTNNIARTGHTVSCDHIINLVDMEKAGLLNSGDYLVLFGLGGAAVVLALAIDLGLALTTRKA